MIFDYKALKLKIKEVFNTQAAFAAAMGKSESVINQMLNNAIQWKTADILKACRLLKIDLAEMYKYFFVEKL